MHFSLSTRWNASEHSSGEAMLEEILGLGLTHVELGYDLGIHLVPGVTKMVSQGAVTVDSVHAFCPVPSALPYGHPELFSLTATKTDVRERAVMEIAETINFAEEVRAKIVVLHAGRVDMKNITQKLIHLVQKNDGPYTPRFEKTKAKLIIKRDKKVKKQIDFLYQGLEALLPTLERAKIVLGLECLPSWETMPTEGELLKIIDHFKSPWLGYWHDIGHGFTRQTLGFVNTVRWLDKLHDHVAGFHVHDVRSPASDHIMPPSGDVDFSIFQPFVDKDIPAVLEPCPGLMRESLVEGIGILAETWGIENPAKGK